MEKLMIINDVFGGYIPRALCSTGRDGEIDDIDGCSDFCKDRSENDNCTGCAIQECFNRLGEYEATNLTPDQMLALPLEWTAKAKELMEYRKIGTIEECREAMEKQTQKKALRKYMVGNVTIGDCPSCDMPVVHTDSYCHHCGQKLD